MNANRLSLLAVLAVLVGVAAYVGFDRASSSKPALLPTASPTAARAEPARQAPDTPFGTVDGSEPHTHLTLLSLRRTGPKVVTARLRIELDRHAGNSYIPELLNRDLRSSEKLAGENMRLVDEVNGREHFPLRDADGKCLCSGIFTTLFAGDASVISAKFPAPPPNVDRASLVTPGFPSFDAVPLS